MDIGFHYGNEHSRGQTWRTESSRRRRTVTGREGGTVRKTGLRAPPKSMPRGEVRVNIRHFLSRSYSSCLYQVPPIKQPNLSPSAPPPVTPPLLLLFWRGHSHSAQLLIPRTIHSFTQGVPVTGPFTQSAQVLIPRQFTHCRGPESVIMWG